MHIDPISTDAFNALFRGHKWWVYLPKDLYEFEDELTCDAKCSDFDQYRHMQDQELKDVLNLDYKHELWLQHILPQIRLLRKR